MSDSAPVGTMQAGEAQKSRAKTGDAQLSQIPRMSFPRPPHYAYMLPLAPFLLVFASNVHRVEPAMVLMASAVAVICYCALTMVLGAVSRRPALTDTIVACLFIGAVLGAYFATAYQWPWMAFWFVVAVAACRIPAIRAPLTLCISFMATVAVVYASVLIVASPTLWERSALTRGVEQSFPNIPVAGGDTAAKAAVKRDIYYIVLDRYARADQLKDVYGFDNTAFLDALRDHGFAIADNAYSNYQRTAHSLSSSLNMDYLRARGDADEQAAYDWMPIYRRLQESRLGNALASLGFEFHFFGSWWEPTRRNSKADVEVNYRAWPELLRVVFENSLAGKLAAELQLRDLNPRQLQCRRAKMKFAALADSATRNDSDVPRFIFAHFLVPHPPFVIDGEGNCLSAETVTHRSRERNYVEQVKYANSRVLDFISRVRQSDGPEPIIILQADEGPWPKRYARDETHRLGGDVRYVEWLDTTPAELREKMAILNALYLPGLEDLLIAPDMTPVNNFRLVLREYFGMDLPTLPNRSYVYPNKRNIYQFHDVTTKLRH